ncbi:transposase family protein [Streptomyces sp. NPDC059009]|uniref:transposase family protein n=1 Tax=Streptomyces sp. NPDC059009 TaxID=3346694 RepID=UPI0036CC3075
MTAHPQRREGTCPECGQRSSQVHCSYERCLADQPVAGCRSEVRLRVRRFTCSNSACSHRTFAEQIPALTRRRPAISDRARESCETHPNRPLTRMSRCPWTGEGLARSRWISRRL